MRVSEAGRRSEDNMKKLLSALILSTSLLFSNQAAAEALLVYENVSGKWALINNFGGCESSVNEAYANE
jgi:hypothetical protein